ncbi:insulinase family protein [Baekduia soli]|uniref:Insulinase family protein n=1 Tax=Baekduia soli TaxID=496014 RepID=A0A5B8U7N7_9ACTN|nr:pitrilysin family protein [Baekduia soli]QEC48935.1 insulinase family protein [Baekduia soli]
MHEEHRLTELDSGVRVVTEHMDSVRSAALGFWIGTGSGYEDEERAGLSHLLEHMLFRGTARYGSLEIDQIFDGMGAEINAGTGKETTSVYSRVLDVHLERAFDVMADMVWRPKIASDDLEQEREIVLEEIAMYEDDPQDRVFDVLGEAVFGTHPLGRAIIGRRDVVGGTPAADLQAFHAARYGASNVVVAAAGSVDHDRLVELVARSLDGPRSAGTDAEPPEPPTAAVARRRFFAKDTEQYHVALGAPGIARDDERRFALRVLDGVLGGTSSSRLFQEVRERRGLAYSVYSFTSSYAGAGQVGLYLGTRPDNVATAMRVVGDELARLLQDGLTADELQRSRENVKGRVVLALESTTARMNRLGSSVLADMPLLTVDDVVERLDAVTLDDVVALARELYAPERLSAAGIGADEGLYTAALEAVSPSLATV